MIRRLLRPVLRLLPPLWTIATFLFCYGVIRAVEVFCCEMIRGLDPATVSEILRPLAIMESGAATFGAVLFALWRVCALHPIANWEYRQWLERTPWTPDRPLPMGSVFPGVVDVVVVALLCWLAGNVWPFSPMAPILGYLAAMTIAVCVIVGFTRQRIVLYSVLFGLGLALRLAASPLALLLVLAATFPLVLVGLRRSLEPECWPDFALSLSRLTDDKNRASKELGWPFGFLGPKAVPRLVRWPDTLAIALLSGWFLHAMLSHLVFCKAEDLGMCGIFLFGLAMLALARAFGYVLMYAAPISPLGRLLTGRWIIPRYDRVFVASLWAAMAAALGELIIALFAVPVAMGQPVVVALCAFLLLAVGPSFRNWQLTGGHRIHSSTVCNKASQYLQV